MRPPWACLWLAACTVGGPKDGTSVGNPPGLLRVAATEVPAGIHLDRVDLGLHEVVLEHCVLGAQSVGRRTSLDLLQPQLASIPVPAGRWCALTLVVAPEAPLRLEGRTAAGTRFAALVDPGEISFDGTVFVDANTLLAEIPVEAFLDPTEIDALGREVYLGPTSPTARDWAETVERTARLVVFSPDGTAMATALPEAAALAGCATTGGGTPSAAAALLALALVTSRRRRVF